ncbi:MULTISPECIES: FAD-dependent oxidoreductase [unclassified Novosphingobium]|uniref:FAD-dependent oxidoreductase n=1 Tax=unclassified Novosphingobium TaxID=2644732 RepID=UPI000D31F20E|nr:MULTISPECIES: FAD-dependent oxidoreductase [unclassified Novosphingobium]PTR07618.1 2-polyprenyl-6-methoxyphenol hydroxylase-like FAD-dependent oxidoreductase [Novosphingobium sp. GV055]PUB00320.1 2-polyprenyl-6-methoxyphenol hydroxylase-like FAD-dependent oxidoreductase [Novosphingobium sp. GV061]PUB15361.1 2-polyprenyl-6-methoxyphenol hydroxylase-like FAD-dependent oxidoreductase [Novosphingobium sp. GV079]PUB39237.1 2-polyprenyl-6-methoxyphenol hydroxylase-like FAD-dependent oxidoreductas
MTSVRSALIIGGGIGGMSSALVLRRLGVAVDLIDIDPAWRVYGAGITITSPTLRAFDQLGILDDVLRDGFSGNGIRVCTIEGQQVGDVPDPAGMPGSGGIMRPTLHRILSEKTRASGATVRLGLTVDALHQRDDQVDVVFSDGGRASYDLVLGADGVFSRTRSLILPDAPQPEYTGQTIWRLFADRPAEIDRRHFFLGGPVKVGLSPVSRDSLYMFLLETCPRRSVVPDEELYLGLRDLLDGYGGPLRALREGLGPRSQIVMRPLEAFLLPPPWHVGRVLLIGDAAHPTTPHLASGAGMAVEDAIVLGEELARGDDLPEVLARFAERRTARCQLVVRNSMEIGRLERAGAPPAEQTRIVGETLAMLAQPI